MLMNVEANDNNESVLPCSLIWFQQWTSTFRLGLKASSWLGHSPQVTSYISDRIDREMMRINEDECFEKEKRSLWRPLFDQERISKYFITHFDLMAVCQILSVNIVKYAVFKEYNIKNVFQPSMLIMPQNCHHGNEKKNVSYHAE